jgi:hypothetical protein
MKRLQNRAIIVVLGGNLSLFQGVLALPYAEQNACKKAVCRKMKLLLGLLKTITTKIRYDDVSKGDLLAEKKNVASNGG